MTIDRYNKKAISYDVIVPGLNYRFDEIRSALGIEQFKKLDNNNTKRKKLTEIYRDNLSKINGVIVPWSNKMTDRKSSYHIMPIMLPEKSDRRSIIEYMKNKGIQTSIHYPAFDTFSYYAKRIKQELKIAKKISARELTLPLYPMMAKNDVEFVCQTLKEGLYAQNKSGGSSRPN
jgi:dTDP-4-amino-4,6-dideoxygalactose transaminase